MTRNGKIARLPNHIRDDLNRRLENGEPGTALVEWLNRIPEVNMVITNHFDGRPINEQNLSEWKQGGFLDWQRLQESCEWVRMLAGEADQLTDESGIMPLSDRLSSMVSLALGKVIREFASRPLDDVARRQEFLQLLKELARLRREDREAALMRNHLEAFPPVSARRRRAAAHGVPQV
jgi:hypothetical protein